MKRTLSVAVATIFLATGVAGCFGGNEATDDKGTPGVPNPKTYVIQTAGEAESLDPAYDYESAGGQIITNVYETLYGYNGTSAEEFVPRLAAEMPTLSADKSELTIKLRAGVRFHDGTEMTADDVKYSLDRIILTNDPDSPAFIYYGIKGGEAYGTKDVTTTTAADRQAYLAAGGVTIIDPSTIKITLEYADPSFLSRLAFQAASIVSKDAFCANSPANFVDCLPPPGETRHEWADENEAGSGPFMLERWAKGQEIVLKRFDNYWGKAPTLERVIIKKVGDFNTRLLALKSGEADDVYIPVDHDIDVMGQPGVQIIEDTSWSVSFIGFNQKYCGGPEAAGFASCMESDGDDVPKGADGTGDPLFFGDIHMRKAWTYAFDYDTYLNNIVNGHGENLNGMLPSGIFGYDASIPPPKQDLVMARAELALSNHPTGFRVTIFYNSDNTVREKTAELLAQNMMELGPGIQVEAKGLDWSTAFLPKQRAAALPVFYLGWLPDYAYPDNYAVTFAHSTKGVYTKRLGYANAELDTLLDGLLRETDEAALKKGYHDAVVQVNEDYVYLWLAQASNFHVQRDWVKGYYYNPMHSGQPNAGDFSTLSKA